VTSPALQYASIPAAWRARVEADPQHPAIRFFDGMLTAHDVDRFSDELAAEFEDRGVAKGDRVAVYLQNIPYHPIVMLALFKIGAIGVLVNPMYRGAELRRLIDDSGAIGIVAGGRDLAATRAALDGSSVRWVLSASDTAFQTRNDPRVFDGLPPAETSPDGDLDAVLARATGRRHRPVELTPDDTAFLTYTSGTTGPPKGAINSHGNVLHSIANFSEWISLTPDDVVLAIAPMFHITGIVINAGIALLGGATLVLTSRYHAGVVADAFMEHGVTFTIGSITAFNAMLALPEVDKSYFHAVRLLYSGGAPIAPSTIERFRARTGHYLHNVWGMTETTAAGIGVPAGVEAPVDPRSGSLSIGKAMQNVTLRAVDETGNDVPPGEEGELEFSAPQTVSGYWQNPEATAHTLPGGRLRTGDVAVLDAEGWVYLVDRLKDLINASGFKVWPREVEDALYEHPAVFEAAVVGEPDEYRGETVVAYVSLNPGHAIEPDELIAFTKQRLAAYKYPRRVHIVDALPKTVTGKIRRAEVRGSSDGRKDAP
jgi:long-chain acyl-CoA synthetase